MKSQLPCFNLLQLINLKHFPKDKRLPRNVMKLIGKYRRVMYRFYSDIFDIYHHHYPRFSPCIHHDFAKDMTKYMIILVKDMFPKISTYKETEGGATNAQKLLALYQTVRRIELLPLHIKKHPDKPNHLEWMLIKDDHNSTAKEARHASGTFKAFKCPQHQQDQWDAATKRLANEIIQEVFAWELSAIVLNKANIIV
jgi:hypothetical protein